ncbi:MAG: molybdopterin molybdotransferase MoeA [Bacteroidota bacterium]
MISYDEALRLVLSETRSLGTERIDLNQSLGRVSSRDWIADRPLPPFDRVTMDGIAFRFSEAEEQESLSMVNIIAAGQPRFDLPEGPVCVEVMTGAVLPHGADTVVRYEDVDITDGRAKINTAFQAGQNIHRKGLDRSEGEVVLTKGSLIGPAEIGLAASIGLPRIETVKVPRVMVISTGDELVPVDTKPLPHQIRRSNVHAIAALLQDLGINAETTHLPDQANEIQTELSRVLHEYDVIILSGGVSKGKYDYIPEVLASCGVKKLFHRVAQKPGKPLWFGSKPAGAVVFGLPGNPVSSFMCTVVYVRAWIQSCLGVPSKGPVLGVLDEDIHFDADLTYFVPVSINYQENGTMHAHPKRGQGSGDLANLTRAGGFVRLDRGQNHFSAGEIYPIYPFSN